MPKVNPEIIRWARETAGLSLEEATRKLTLREARGVSAIERLIALETGDKEPTRSLLVRMAKHYRRPLLTFYMTAAPRKGDRGQDFRTLPTDYSDTDEALLDALIRNVKARQSMVRAMLEEEEDTKPLLFVGSARRTQGVPALLSSIQETIRFERAEFRAKTSSSEAFTFLRDRVEAAGVFVLLIGNLGSYHTTIDLQTFRGFALADDIAPFVIINDQDARSAWSFTLLHELVHIWLGQTGVSGWRVGISLEKFCDDVASEFLLPRSELAQLDVDETTSFEAAQNRIAEFARSRNVSASMVAYKLYRTGTIDLENWKHLSENFRQMWIARRNEERRRVRDQRRTGPTYYPVRRHRIGKALLELVGAMMRAGAITTSKAGKVLGVKGKNVQTLIDAGRSL
ncbi:MAG: ImmA/IrrE family metallo-endopeptidase [Sedimentisphaerales bacterium]|nr:ImmA/IrrE family metallo-endopeptidase [Sedimentisphaerales bacterium]